MSVSENGGVGDKEGANELISAGAEIVGGLAAVAIGVLVAGPVGGVVGAFATPITTRIAAKIGAEFSERILAPREKVRVGATLAQAVIKVRERLDAGDVLRDDGFFDAQEGNRPAAEEVLEGGLIAAQQEHEELKLPFIGNLLGNLDFAPGISRAAANLLIRSAHRMSYRQLKLLSFAARVDELGIRDIPPNAEAVGSSIGRLPDDLIQEVKELDQLGILNASALTYSMTRFNPRLEALTPLGQRLYQLMNLEQLPPSELVEITGYY
jgi:hypothetical protein